MQRLLFRALREFVCDGYGEATWDMIAEKSGQPALVAGRIVNPKKNEIPNMLAAASQILKTGEQGLLEDLGTFLVSREGTGKMRRLLRFTGASFVEFLLSLDELPDRIRLALPDLEVPEIGVVQHGDEQIQVSCGPGQPGLISLLVGLIRAMADDYGALATVDRMGPENRDGSGCLVLRVHDSTFSNGRGFSLAAGDG
jgi:hypothetical protein